MLVEPDAAGGTSRKRLLGHWRQPGFRLMPRSLVRLLGIMHPRSDPVNRHCGEPAAGLGVRLLRSDNTRSHSGDSMGLSEAVSYSVSFHMQRPSDETEKAERT